jgi:hypothetical protein
VLNFLMTAIVLQAVLPSLGVPASGGHSGPSDQNREARRRFFACCLLLVTLPAFGGEPACSYPESRAEAAAYTTASLGALLAGRSDDFFAAVEDCAHPGTRREALGLATARESYAYLTDARGTLRAVRLLDSTSFAHSFFRVTYDLAFTKGTSRLMLTWRRKSVAWAINQVIISE